MIGFMWFRSDSLPVSSTNVFGFLEVRVWASGKNLAAGRTLRLRSSQKATEAISRRSRGCSVRVKSWEQISAWAEHGNVGLQPQTLCRDQRHQQGFGQSHRWIKTGEFPLIKILKSIQEQNAVQPSRPPEAPRRCQSFQCRCWGGLPEKQSCWSKNSCSSQSQIQGSASSRCCPKGQMGFNEQNHTVVKGTYKSASISSGYFRDE